MREGEEKEDLARGSAEPVSLTLNRVLRDPSPSSRAGLLAPLVQPGRGARAQLHRPVRSAGRRGSSGRRRRGTGV